MLANSGGQCSGHVSGVVVVVQLLSHVGFLRRHGLHPTRLLCPWDFPGKTTGVGFHFLLQESVLIQGSNLCRLHWQVDSLPLSQEGSPSGVVLCPKSFQTVLACFIHSFVNYLYNIHCLVAQSCATLCTPRLLCPWDSPGKNTGVDSHALLQGIFPAQMDSLPSEPPRKHNYPHNYNADSSLVC